MLLHFCVHTVAVHLNQKCTIHYFRTYYLILCVTMQLIMINHKKIMRYLKKKMTPAPLIVKLTNYRRNSPKQTYRSIIKLHSFKV